MTLIDFTLSRLQTASGGIAFCNLTADPELFNGPKGDCQVRRHAAHAAALSRVGFCGHPCTSVVMPSECTQTSHVDSHFIVRGV